MSKALEAAAKAIDKARDRIMERCCDPTLEQTNMEYAEAAIEAYLAHLAEDEAVVERAARAFCDTWGYVWDGDPDDAETAPDKREPYDERPSKPEFRKAARAAIAAMRPALSEAEKDAIIAKGPGDVVFVPNRPAPKLTEEERPIWGVWVDYNRAPPGSYACLVSSFVNGQWSEPEARWMPAQGRPKLEGKIRVMPHLMPGDPLIDKLTEAG